MVKREGRGFAGIFLPTFFRATFLLGGFFLACVFVPAVLVGAVFLPAFVALFLTSFARRLSTAPASLTFTTFLLPVATG
jgi:hypothetical protein